MAAAIAAYGITSCQLKYLSWYLAGSRTLPCTTACSPYTITLPGAETMNAGIMGLDCLRFIFFRPLSLELLAPLVVSTRPESLEWPLEVPVLSEDSTSRRTPLWPFVVRCVMTSVWAPRSWQIGLLGLGAINKGSSPLMPRTISSRPNSQWRSRTAAGQRGSGSNGEFCRCHGKVRRWVMCA